nr:hypothetical protein [Tanacetum cinerariifolium]
MINAQVDDLSVHNTKYTSSALTQKVFANTRRIGTGFSRVDTPLFDGMLVTQQVRDVEDIAEDEDADNEVFAEPTPPLPTPVTPPPSPPQEHIPSPPQAQTAQPSSPPPPPPQPSQTTDISMTLLNTLLETCATLTKQVANMEQDKIAQAIKITKLKQRVKGLEKKRQFKSSGLKRLKKVGTTQRVESSADTVMDDQEDASKQEGKFVELDADEDVTLVFSMQDTDEAEPAKVEEVIEVVIAAKLMTEVVTTAATTITVAQVPKASAPRRRRGVVIQDPEETAIASVIVHSEVKSKDKGNAELNANINWNDVMKQVKRKEKQDNTVTIYQTLKRKLVTKAQARKNIMIYLKNMVGFKMDFFKGMTYNDIRPIFEKHYKLNQAFLERVEKEVIEELKTHLQIVANDDDDVYTEATPLALKGPVVDYQIHHEHNKPYYKIIRADETHQLFLNFIALLKNFNREDLVML